MNGNGVIVSSLGQLKSSSVRLNYSPNSCLELGSNVRRCNRDEGEKVNEKWTYVVELSGEGEIVRYEAYVKGNMDRELAYDFNRLKLKRDVLEDREDCERFKKKARIKEVRKWYATVNVLPFDTRNGNSLGSRGRRQIKVRMRGKNFHNRRVNFEQARTNKRNNKQIQVEPKQT